MRSNDGSAPVAEVDSQVVETNKNAKGTLPFRNLQMMSILSGGVEEVSSVIATREKQLMRQQKEVAEGKQPIGTYRAKDLGKVLDEGWT